MPRAGEGRFGTPCITAFTATGSCLYLMLVACGRVQSRAKNIQLSGRKKRSAKTQASAEEGGPRSSCARKRPARAASRSATGAYTPETRAGQCAGAAVATNTGATVAGSTEGNCGQCEGALKAGPELPLCGESMPQ